MNTSYKSLFPSSAPPPAEAFSYPEAQGADGSISGAATEAVDSGDEVAQLLLRAHAEGVREGEDREQSRGQQQLEQEHAKITETILRFQTAVAEYFSRIELEVVQLALAIATKILHREAKADPLLVSKLAKGILQNLHQQTKVNVRVPPGQTEAWQDELSPHDDGQMAIVVIPDESVQADSCVLQTELGLTEVSVAAQLREIENGMLDLLAQTPDRP